MFTKIGGKRNENIQRDLSVEEMNNLFAEMVSSWNIRANFVNHFNENYKREFERTFNFKLVSENEVKLAMDQIKSSAVWNIDISIQMTKAQMIKSVCIRNSFH